MAKANPFAQIAKRLASLQAKSAKVTQEISVLVQVVNTEMKKQADTPAPAKAASGKASAKAGPAKAGKTLAAPKKRGRPARK